MSRNQREGRYVGALLGRHYRSRGMYCAVSGLDVCIEVEMRRMRATARLFNGLFADTGLPLYMFADDRASALEGETMRDQSKGGA